MHTPTAFVLRCADSPSHFYPGDCPSHHLSHPLTARPHTLSKHISFFLYSFLYFFIFPPFLSFRLFFFFLFSHLPFLPFRQRFFSLGPFLGFSFAIAVVFLSLSLSGRRVFIPSSPAIVHFFPYFRHAFVLLRRSSFRISHNQAAKAFERSRLARLPDDLSDYREVPWEKFIAAKQDNG